MAGCCDPNGFNAVFGERFARRVARHYRKRGLDKTAGRMVSFLTDQGIEDATVLEIGGGVGEIQVELLRRGAARATNLEIATTYEAEAVRLLEEFGLTDRATRRFIDIAESPGDVEAADVVVLHRVVCCYPDYQRLLTAAGGHARRLLVFSHPPRNAVSRAFFWVQGGALRISGRTFRAFAHPPDAMIEVLREQGLTIRYQHRGMPWHIAGLER